MSKKQALRLYDLLESKCYGISRQSILDDLDISTASFKRALAYLRQQGITVYPPQNGGYRLDKHDKGLINLGGALLNETQMGLLLESHQRLSMLVQADIHQEELKTILQRMEKILNQTHSSQCIEVIHQQARRINANYFKRLLQSIEMQQCINACYQARSSGKSSRILSPQKLIYYRGNWYLIAWCHTKKTLRTFAMERFSTINTVTQTYQRLPEKKINAFCLDTYGIFGGKKCDIARIQFSKAITEWIKDELWHPEQSIEEKNDGSIILTIPIGEVLTELVMDLMKYGGNVQVLYPERLKKQLLTQHQAAIEYIGSSNEP